MVTDTDTAMKGSEDMAHIEAFSLIWQESMSKGSLENKLWVHNIMLIVFYKPEPNLSMLALRIFHGISKIILQ